MKKYGGHPRPRVFFAKSAQWQEKEGLRFDFVEENEKSAEEFENKRDRPERKALRIAIYLWGRAKMGRVGVHPPGICKDVKGKGLRKGAFVKI